MWQQSPYVLSYARQTKYRCRSLNACTVLRLSALNQVRSSIDTKATKHLVQSITSTPSKSTTCLPRVVPIATLFHTSAHMDQNSDQASLKCSLTQDQSMQDSLTKLTKATGNRKPFDCPLTTESASVQNAGKKLQCPVGKLETDMSKVCTSQPETGSQMYDVVDDSTGVKHLRRSKKKKPKLIEYVSSFTETNPDCVVKSKQKKNTAQAKKSPACSESATATTIEGTDMTGTSPGKLATGEITDMTGKRSASAREGTDMTGKRSVTAREETDMTGKRSASAREGTDMTGKRSASTREGTDMTGKRSASAREGTDMTGKRSASTREGTNMVELAKNPRRIRPNAFVSIRLPSKEIRKGIWKVQKSLVAHDRDMSHVVTSLDKLHLTVLVLRLYDDSDIERAKSVLSEAAMQVVAEFNLMTEPLSVNFKGLGSFDQKVLFAQVEEGAPKQKLINIADAVRTVFESRDFPGMDERSFKPHLTVAKMSTMPYGIVRKHKSRTGMNKGIEKEAYLEFLEAEFGSQVVSGLELLSMTEPKDDDGYYHCFSKAMF